LSDGTKVSQSVPVSRNGLWPLYIPLYSGKGSIMSWIAFTNQVDTDLNGALSWIKPADSRARYYPGGFTNECNVIGSAYTPPASSTNFVLGFTNAQVVFSGGNLNSSFTNSLAFRTGNRVTNLSSNRL